MADKSPLRRWKRFFPAFGAIDAAIESALGCSRDKHRRVRGDLVEKLCDCDAAGDGGGAEALCLLLDQAMVEALQTLRLVPATPAMLTSTTDVAGAVADLRGHGSGRVRALARRVLDGWRASVERDLARARAALEALSRIPREDETAAAAPPSTRDARSGREPKVLVANVKRAAMVPRPKKMPPGVCGAGGEKTGDAKRKHPGGYCREAEDVKRQRKVPEMVGQRSTKANPTMEMKERSRASLRAGD